MRAHGADEGEHHARTMRSNGNRSPCAAAALVRTRKALHRRRQLRAGARRDSSKLAASIFAASL